MNRHPRDERVHQNVSATERLRFEEFAGLLLALGRTAKTVDSYRSDWLGLAAWWVEKQGTPFDAANLDGAVARHFKSSLVDGQMSPATINRKLVFLKRYSDWLRAERLMDEDTWRGLRGVEPVSQTPRRPRPLSDLEVRRFLRVIDGRAGVRDQAIIYTLLQTGLRVSELVALRREQLSLQSRSGHVTVEEARGGRLRERRIPVGAEARRRLRTYLDERGDHDGVLFEGERGPLTANGVQRMMRKYCGFAQVRVSPQTLRHTFATGWLHEHADDLAGLADLLGHETIETTRLYLAGGADDERRPAAAG
jgi:site-specific recombinase XerD